MANKKKNINKDTIEMMRLSRTYGMLFCKVLNDYEKLRESGFTDIIDHMEEVYKDRNQKKDGINE